MQQRHYYMKQAAIFHIVNRCAIIFGGSDMADPVGDLSLDISKYASEVKLLLMNVRIGHMQTKII